MSCKINRNESARLGISAPAPAMLAIAALLGLCLRAQAGWDGCTLITADLHQQEHLSINTWNDAQGLSATNADGNLVTIPSRNILSLASGSQSARQIARIGWELRLRNGDVLYGPSAGRVQGDYLLFDAPEIDGNLAVRLTQIIAIIAPGAANGGSHAWRSPADPAVAPGAPAPSPDGAVDLATETGEFHLPDPGADDLVILKDGGDQLSGEFTSLDGDSLHFKVNGTPTTINTARLAAIVMGGARPPRKIPPLSVRLTFASSVLTVPLKSFSWSLAQATITDAMGKDHQVPTSKIIHMEVLGGRAVYLTDMDPSSEEQVSFLGSEWPCQMNKNVMGQPLQVGKNSFDRGIGVHTQSTLTYLLDPKAGFDTLSIRVGLDDSAAPLGTAKASIVLNGRVLWKSDGLKPGEISPVITLPITGGGKLELHADPTSHLDVQGRVDWIEPMLLRN